MPSEPRSTSKCHCSRCGVWKYTGDFRLLTLWGGSLFSPLCKECEDPRRPTRFDRIGVAPPMPTYESSLSGADLYETCRETLRAHQDLRTAFWAGDTTAMKKLVTKAMSASKGQLHPADVERELTTRLTAWPQIRRIEDELWGVWDWGTEEWISTHGDVFDAEPAWEKTLNERGFLPVSPLSALKPSG